MNKRDRIILVTPICLASVLMIFFAAVVRFQLLGPSDGIVEFCETCKTGFIREPANTWSNLGFICFGIYAAYLLATKKYYANNNSLTRNFFYSLTYPCLMVFLGPGSMLKHATQTGTGGFFDMLSMYLLASFISAYAIQRFFKLSFARFAAIFVVVLLCCIWANFTHCTIVFNFFGNTVFAFFLGIGVFFEALNIFVRKTDIEVKWAYYALASLIASFIIWNLSRTGTPFCDSDSLLQGHAAWHLGTALATFLMFRYYVSENVISR